MKLKDDYMDIFVLCPLTKVNVYSRFIPEELYGIYIQKGYGFMFEPIKNEKEDDIIS